MNAPSQRTTVLAAAGLAIAGVLVYANSFRGPFIFDDLLSIPQNPTIRTLSGSLAPPGGGLTVTGRPLLNLSFALNYAVSGDRVWSYHAVNLLIHLLAGLTLFGIVRRTLKTDQGAGIAFGSALLWTVHPLQTESVTYLVQRAESLMGLFYLLTLYCLLRGAAGAERRPALWFVFSWMCCLAGMATKEVMVTAPIVALLYDRTFLAGSFREAWRRRKTVHVALAATWIPLAAWVLGGSDRGGTAGFGVGVSFGSYLATQFQAVAHYLWLSAWPKPLVIDYGVQWARSAGEVAPYAVLVALLLSATAVALVRMPALGFLGAFFFAILAPTSLVPGTRQTLAEHRMYLSLAPVMIGVVLALHAWLGRRARLVVAAAAAGLGWTAAARNLDYRSDLAIWADTVAKRPDNAAAQNNYGNVLARSGRLEEAVGHYERAIRLEPRYVDAYSNAGDALGRLGRLPEAIGSFEQALRLNPNDAQIHNDLGNALQAAGRPVEAIEHYERALRLKPDNADAHNNLGISLLVTGRAREAIAQFEEALRLNPGLAQVHLNLAAALASVGRSREAEEHYEAAQRLGAAVPTPGR